MPVEVPPLKDEDCKHQEETQVKGYHIEIRLATYYVNSEKLTFAHDNLWMEVRHPRILLLLFILSQSVII